MHYIIVVVVVGSFSLDQIVKNQQVILKRGYYIGDLYLLPIGYWPYGLWLVQTIEALPLLAHDHCTVIWVLHPVGRARYY